MAPKTKVEEKADQAKQIAEAVEGAIAAWSPPIALLAKGIRVLITSARRRGEISEDEAASFLADADAADALINQMAARSAEYRRRRALETGTTTPADHSGD